MSSSPRNIGGTIREGTRVVLREITASLHNSPPMHVSRSKSGNDSSIGKSPEHEVKVRFAREFADVGSISYSAAESLSSASSFQSLSSSLSAKSSSGICPDSVPQSPSQPANNSYVNSDIPGVEDLILACADIRLNGDEEHSFNAHELSQDQTFTSATDDTIADLTQDIYDDVSPVISCNVTQIVGNDSASQEIPCSSLNYTQDIRDRPILVIPSRNNSFVKAEDSKERSISPNKSNDLISSLETCSFAPANENEEQFHAEKSNLNSTVCLSANEPVNTCEPSLTTTASIKLDESDVHEVENDGESLLSARTSWEDLLKTPDQEIEDKSVSRTERISASFSPATNDEESCANLLNDIVVPGSKTPDVKEDSEASICTDIVDTSANRSSVELSSVRVHSPEVNVSLLIKDEKEEKEKEKEEEDKEVKEGKEEKEEEAVNEEKVEKGEVEEKKEEKEKEEEDKDKLLDEYLKAKGIVVIEKTEFINSEIKKEKENEREKEESSSAELDTTLTFQDIPLNLETVPELKAQRQNTILSLPIVEQSNFDELKTAAEEVVNDILKSSFEFSEEGDRFISATSQLFQEPMNLDFLITHGNAKTVNRLHAESLYVKFDPLVSNISMLPQGNVVEPINDEQNGKNDSALANIVTPKRNPAIAAIDRLLFYSPLSTSMTQKMEEPREKIERPTEESKPETPPLSSDVDMSKELELVRTTVLQLEEELEKQKKEYETELERQKASFQEKINKLQTQMAQEVKSKSQMTVVVEEYEKSISRLLTEKERDRTNFAQEKAKLQEELQATNVHLANTEAAFNDVHQKYERLKGIVSAYKSNEAVLKESIQENLETIQSLEARYEQLKNHAMTQLEKANFELDSIRKQHEDETVKLHAIVRKSELKSNSLADLVEQKTKENKELTQILDEVIARVGHQSVE